MYVFVFVPLTADAPKRLWQGSSCSAPAPPCSPSPHLYLFPPSHLIAFDKCPYWLHIIRCGGGSLRLYYSAHIPQLSPLPAPAPYHFAWLTHLLLQRFKGGQGLCQWSGFVIRRFTWQREASSSDMVARVTAKLRRKAVLMLPIYVKFTLLMIFNNSMCQKQAKSIFFFFCLRHFSQSVKQPL